MLDFGKDANTAIDVLENNGFEAYFVGGCLRDALMGKPFTDIDITTSALPDEIKIAFKDYRVIETGIAHGTLTVVINKTHLEITTFRTEGSYSDFRHPDFVAFTKDIKKDLSRRDFTINSLAYSSKRGLVDLFNGKEDMENKIIRATGDPKTRFTEDALRILRCLRFASVLGFTIESSTALATENTKHLLKNISKERISTELNKLLLGDFAYKVVNSHINVLREILPLPIENNLDKLCSYLPLLPKDLSLRFSLLFYYGENSPNLSPTLNCKNTLQALKYDNSTINATCAILSNIDYIPNSQSTDIKFNLNKMGMDTFRKVLAIKRVIMPLTKENTILFNYIEKTVDYIAEMDICYNMDTLNLSGKDIISLGITNGIDIGKIKKEILDLVINNRVSNNKNEILEYIRKNLL